MGEIIIGRRRVLAPTDEERREAWLRHMGVCAAAAERLHEAGAVDEARALRAMIDGGVCPRCDTPFEQVIVDNAVALGRWFKPTCGCYPDDQLTREVAGRVAGRDSHVYVTGRDLRASLRAQCDGEVKSESGTGMVRCRAPVMVTPEQRVVRMVGGVPKYPRVLCGRCRAREEGRRHKAEAEE